MSQGAFGANRSFEFIDTIKNRDVYFAKEKTDDDIRSVPFEFNSNGDRVSARLLQPVRETDLRSPLVLLGHGAGGNKNSDYVDKILRPWVKHGVVAAVIDLPLHGGRADTKFTPYLLSALSKSSGFTDLDNSFFASLAFQASNDFQGVLDIALSAGIADPSKVVFAGFSLGAILGTLFCVKEPRIRRVALALGGGGFGSSCVDTVNLVGLIAPRPVLFVNAIQDEIISRNSAKIMHDAAEEPKTISWYDCKHSELPGVALREIWEFLFRSLK